MRTAQGIIATLCAGLLLFSCSTNQLAGGTGEETTNGRVIGSIVRSNGTPVEHVEIQLFQNEYDPYKDTIAILKDTTDEVGIYLFPNINPGMYTLLGTDRGQENSMLTSDVTVTDSTVIISPKTLLPGGTMKIMVPNTVDTLRGYMYIPGTNIVTDVTTSTGFITFNSVPAGTIRRVNYNELNNPMIPRIVATNIEIPSGGTVTLSYTDWLHNKKLYLNTTASGADIPVTVTNFPVLLRLTQANFAFNEAQRNGEDLRFTNSDNTPLSFEIETWDSLAQLATIWVNVDAVLGNNSTQYITCYWGNALAQSESSSPAVFSQSNGFNAVWHLDIDCMDATGNDHNGTNYGAVTTAGIIGSSMRFDGADSIRIPGLIGTPQNITISAWAQLDSAGPKGSEVLSLGDDVVIRMDDTGPLQGSGTRGSYRFDSAYFDYATVSSEVFLRKTGWHHIVYVVNSASLTQSLYVDGVLSKDTAIAKPLYYHAGRNTYIGVHGHEWNNKDNLRSDFFFRGLIDEVRVQQTACSPYWIKLCYMNQKAIDALVVY